MPVRPAPSPRPGTKPVAPLAGSSIAAAALRYRGAGYVYGGPASTPGNWDCSSFVSYVLGHDLRLTLPGGGKFGSPGYPPNAHGPVVTSYSSWTGAAAVASPQAGDLCCWVGGGPSGHIGIAISGTQMISALNPAQGTMVTAIMGTGPVGAPLVFRRVKGVPGGGPGLIVPGLGGLPGFGALGGLVQGITQGGTAMGGLLGLALVAGTVGAVLLAAAGVGIVGALAVGGAVAALGIGSRTKAGQ